MIQPIYRDEGGKEIYCVVGPYYTILNDEKPQYIKIKILMVDRNKEKFPDLSGINLIFYNEKKEIIKQGQTNYRGLFECNLKFEEYIFLRVKDDREILFSTKDIMLDKFKIEYFLIFDNNQFSNIENYIVSSQKNIFLNKDGFPVDIDILSNTKWNAL